MPGEAEYAFWHILVRDVAYAQIPRTVRADRHLAAGRWIEEASGERLADSAEILAHHYVEALKLARAVEDEDEVRSLEPLTERFLIMAGDRAMQLDVGKAESYFRQALELLPEDHPRRPEVLARIADCEFRSARLGDSERDYRAAIERLGYIGIEG